MIKRFDYSFNESYFIISTMKAGILSWHITGVILQVSAK